MSIKRNSPIALVVATLLSLSFTTVYADTSNSAGAGKGSARYQTNKEDGSAADAVGSRATLGGNTHFDFQGRTDGSFYPTRTASLQTASGNGSITNHGGPVLTAANIYLIYYGTWTTPCASSGSATPNVVNNFISNLGTSPWYKTNTSYYSTSGVTKNFVSNSVTLSGCSTISSSTFGKTLDNAAGHLISDVVKNQIAANSWPDDANGIYMVLTSSDIAVTEGSKSTFNVNYCGWHSNFTSALGNTLLDAFIGDSGNSSACSVFSGTSLSPNNNPTADAMASVIGHEIVETASDPLGNTWYDKAGYENGDKCAWIFSTGTTAGKSTWSNGGLYNSVANSVPYYLQENVAANLNNCVSVFPGMTNTISTVTPSSSTPGSSITISGTHFSATNYVFINGAAATVGAQSTTSITATLPASASTGPLMVVSDYGVSSVPFTVNVPAPTIPSISPTSAVAGALITITGTALGGTAVVTFGGSKTATPVTATATSVTVNIPAGTTSGPISVTTPGGTATSVTSLTIIPSPTITSLSPASGLIGSTTVISGTNLSGATALKIGTSSIPTFTVNSSTQITATIPTGAKSGAISVTTPGGTATSGTFTVIVTPTITKVSPTSVTQSTALAGGTTITLTVTNVTGSTSVTLTPTTGAATTLSLATVTSTGATFVLPKTQALSTYSIQITNPAGTSAKATSTLLVK